MSTYIKIHNEDELYHYGVKGMKWRKRKAKPATGDDGYMANYYDKDGNMGIRIHTGISPARARFHEAASQVNTKTRETRAKRVDEAGWAMTNLKTKMRVDTFNKTNKAHRRIKKVATTPVRAAKKAVGKGKSFLKNKFKRKK